MHKLVILALSLFGLSITATADDKKDEKIDTTKLVGKWVQKDKASILEFKKDGKVTVAWTRDGQEMKGDGTYKVVGNKVSIALTVLGVEQQMERNVTKLTDDEMVTKDGPRTERTYTRVKDKDKK